MRYKLLAIWLFFTTILSAQTEEKPTIKIKGLVKADYIFDSRQNVEGREGFYIVYPKPKVYDANGLDINAQPSANQYGMTTRIGLEGSGVDVFNAKSYALIETDFTGPSNAHNNVLRLRHAYIRLDWEKTSLLVGQYWSPTDVPEMIPNILSLNTGTPMHAFSRGPQIRVTQKTGAIKWVAVAYAQRDFASNGPEGASSIYLRNAVLPDLSLQSQFVHSKGIVGLGINYKQLKFNSFTSDGKLLSDRLASWSALAFAHFKTQAWDFKVQGVWGQDLSDHLLLGGAAVSSVDSLNAKISYTNVGAYSVWSSVFYKVKGWEFGGFLGYAANLGSNLEIAGPNYARGNNIEYVYRVSPQWYYHIKNLIIANEWEYTVAAYGTPDKFGKVNQSDEVGNFRFTLSLIYIF